MTSLYTTRSSPGCSLISSAPIESGGTDLPQGMAIKKPVEYVEAIPDITEKECQWMLCENPARLLRL